MMLSFPAVPLTVTVDVVPVRVALMVPKPLNVTGLPAGVVEVMVEAP